MDSIRKCESCGLISINIGADSVAKHIHMHVYRMHDAEVFFE